MTFPSSPSIKAFFILFFINSLLSIICQSFFVPDEYWQSLEVAHKIVFGVGHLTWEWRDGIRSFIFPTFFIIIYKFLQIFHIDNYYTLVYLPRIFMSFILTLSELVIWKFSSFKSMILYATLWSTPYFGTRTLFNSFETFLTLLLYYYEAPVFLVVFSFWVRPTTIFASLIFFNFKKNFTLRNIFIGIISVIFFNLYDIFWYRLIGSEPYLFTPFRFHYFNFVKEVAKKYGTQPFLFYIYSVIPSILGPLLIYLPKIKEFKSRKFIFCVVSLLVFSLSSHKEIRFLMQIFPFLIILISKYVSKRMMIFNIILQFIVFIFLSQFHQIGKTNIMHYVYDNMKSTLFLMPCHSTPFYSHAHHNIKMDFFKCPYEGYSESKDFIQNPLEFVNKINVSEYEQIVTYSSFENILNNWLRKNNFVKKVQIYNSLFFIDDINESHVVLLQKEQI